MGYGGDLIWTAAARAYYARHQRPLPLVHRPTRWATLRRRPYTPTRSCVFRHNPHLDTHPRQPPYVFLEDFSWTTHQDGQAMTWRTEDHITTHLCRHVGVTPQGLAGEFFFTLSEAMAVERFLLRLPSGPLVAIQPLNRSPYFGTLRAWPLERWRILVERLAEARPWITVVQVGERTSLPCRSLPRAWDFRLTACFLKEVDCFLGTEGGLMHAAAAVGTKSLILWGGLTPPLLASYPSQTLLQGQPVPCAPCGHLGWCDVERQCMTTIALKNVWEALEIALTTFPEAEE